jgi:cellulose synthase/poly-beta-1,6-N-acetylglucosamine synthase-like glycosyltransferase
MISVIITAYKEERTIARAVERLINPSYNDYKGEFEILIVCPDDQTWENALSKAKQFNFSNIRRIQDPRKGKPFALNLVFREVKGNILVLTDGDVYFGKNVLSLLVKHFENPQVGGVTGRPVSQGKKNNFMQFSNHFYADVAHHKRMVTMGKNVSGKSLKIVSKQPGFFVLSGYILAMRNLIKKVPDFCLAEDAYMSYIIHNMGYRLEYEPAARVYVKYAQNLKDWYKQKLRSVGGYEQLWEYGIVKKETQVRNFWKEFEYALWYPLTYIKSIKEAVWASFLYPTRLFLWLIIFYQHRIVHKKFNEPWARIESTK